MKPKRYLCFVILVQFNELVLQQRQSTEHIRLKQNKTSSENVIMDRLLTQRTKNYTCYSYLVVYHQNIYKLPLRDEREVYIVNTLYAVRELDIDIL